VISSVNARDLTETQWEKEGINKTILSRTSAVRFDERRVCSQSLFQIVMAASYAPSSNNEQPWRFYIAKRETAEFDYLISSMLPQNQDWASSAGALVLACCRTTFERNGHPNRSAYYDLGAAMAFLSLQAEEMGLSVHQIGGFDAALAGHVLKKVDDLVPVVIAAVGFPASEEQLTDADRAKARRNRHRRNLDDLIIF